LKPAPNRKTSADDDFFVHAGVSSDSLIMQPKHQQNLKDENLLTPLWSQLLLLVPTCLKTDTCPFATVDWTDPIWVADPVWIGVENWLCLDVSAV
jgi:hypothetical protein